MHLEACIFDAKSHQILGSMSFLLLARHWLLFLKITKSALGAFLGGRAECAGVLGEILRGLEICKM